MFCLLIYVCPDVLFHVCSVFSSVYVLSSGLCMSCLRFGVDSVFGSVYDLSLVCLCPVFGSVYVLSLGLCKFYLRVCIFPVFGPMYVIPLYFCPRLCLRLRVMSMYCLCSFYISIGIVDQLGR